MFTYKNNIVKNYIIYILYFFGALAMTLAMSSAYAAALPATNTARTTYVVAQASPTQGSKLDADCNKDTNGNGTSLDKKDCGIVGYVITFTNLLSAMVGIIIVIMISVGGVQYTMARDDPQAVAAAKTRIQNAILALVFYLFAFALLQWLVPGGVF